MQKMNEQLARDVAILWQRLVWPRIMYARSLHKLNRMSTIESRIRIVPWPHIESYKALIQRLITARTKNELRHSILDAKEQVIRRINYNSINFAAFDERNVDVSFLQEPNGKLRQEAIEEIIRLFQINENAEAKLMVNPLEWPPVIHDREDGKPREQEERQQAAGGYDLEDSPKPHR